ncbi:rod shape-determining protein MreC [Pusillimonas sp. CC-YST705]|uniref:Cell shape-determining protein MreC n=1 Tax=Mesopusillimonas faecipullorum TaxID=2755040 RepID=A0ABS8CDM4_9BURK|nr:rod shape-determining protein MreC [Mesopusillimonas faecipullorum]MCB5363699.1 rod shape-determining protein MreC [Mesopusillimonas faecipullorum]
MQGQGHGTIRLFKRGPAAEVRLVVYVVLALSMMVVDARWRVLDPARQVVAVALYPFQRLVMLPRDLMAGIDNWTNAASLVRSEKEALQSQRIELAQVATHAAQLAAENQQLRRLLGVVEQVRQSSVAVEVLYEPVNAFTRHLVLNKGSDSGIAPGMPVIDEGGIVGQIVRVTPFTSEAALVTDERVSVPVQVLRNGLRLIAFGGNASGKVEVRYLTGDTDLKAGDVLVTSGVGGLFPAGLPVAQIDEVRHDPATGFAMAEATPLSHPERYRHFLVLLVGNSDPATESESSSP